MTARPLHHRVALEELEGLEELEAMGEKEVRVEKGGMEELAPMVAVRFCWALAEYSEFLIHPILTYPLQHPIQAHQALADRMVMEVLAEGAHQAVQEEAERPQQGAIVFYRYGVGLFIVANSPAARYMEQTEEVETPGGGAGAAAKEAQGEQGGPVIQEAMAHPAW